MTADSLLPRPPDPDAVKSMLGAISREQIVVADRTFLIERPAHSVRLIDNPAVRSAVAADDYLPYWAELWPAARMLAKAILHEPWTPGTGALEIGCGLGLPGIAALSVGLRVTFSDYDPTALRFAADNARLNGFADFQTMRLDWRSPPAGLQVPVLLASDLVYELRSVEPVVAFIKSVLSPTGLCLLTEQERLPSQAMREALADSGLEVTAKTMYEMEAGKRVKGTLYRIRSS